MTGVIGLLTEIKNQISDWNFFKALQTGKIQCLACPRHCQLVEGEIGWCGARLNKGGKIIPRTYGLVSSIAVDPIEKKPLYHFLPGSDILSIGSHGCNLGCLNCQNYSISMNRSITSLRKMPPEELIQIALAKKLPSIASTYNEPMIAFEYVRDIANLAHNENLKMVVVDNGYISRRLAEKLAPLIDAANIDIKGFSKEFYKEICSAPSWKPILKTCEIFHENEVHLEITNLVIPTKNDSSEMINEMCKWIYQTLGEDTPVHFSRFHPDYKLHNIPSTPIGTLEKSYHIAKEVGLNYVYIGNVRSSKGNNSFCPKCDNLLIERMGFYTSIVGLKNGKCTNCHQSLAFILS